MPGKTFLVVFSSAEEAVAARRSLVDAGYADASIEVTADLTSDGVAAEAPGQAYENQQTVPGAGLLAWLRSSFTSITDDDTADAQRLADIQRGAAVLTIEAGESEFDRLRQVLTPHHPIAVRRTG